MLTDAGKIGLGVIALIILWYAGYSADKYIKQEWMREVIRQEQQRLEKEKTPASPVASPAAEQW